MLCIQNLTDHKKFFHPSPGPDHQHNGVRLFFNSFGLVDFSWKIQVAFQSTRKGEGLSVNMNKRIKEKLKRRNAHGGAEVTAVLLLLSGNKNSKNRSQLWATVGLTRLSRHYSI